MSNVRYLATYADDVGNVRVCFTDDRVIFIVKILSNDVLSVKFWSGTDLNKVASFWNMKRVNGDSMQIIRAWESVAKLLRYMKPLMRVKHSDVIIDPYEKD